MKRFFSITLVGALILSLLSPATAFAYQVGPPLPTELQNGSFETNPWSTNTTLSARDVPQADLPGWVTSDPTGIIELWRTGFKAGSTITFDAVPGTGNWFCELNAQVGPPTYIYQDLATTPGALYQWSFYHRGRFGQDTAMMLLGPLGPLTAANAQPAFGGTQVLPGSGVTSPGPQYLVARNSEWTKHLGYYQTTTATTRYGIYSHESVPASGGGASRFAVGNLVDEATWTLIAAPSTRLTLSGNTVNPNIAGVVNTTEGFYGEYAANYDFDTPGSRNVRINVYDANDAFIGSVDSVINVYAILSTQFVNGEGVQIATSLNAFFPSNFADNDPADFAAGAFDYDVRGSAPATITDPNTGIVYNYRGLSTASDPTGLSASDFGTLSGNATVTYVYVPQPQTLRVILVDTAGNILPSPYPTTKTIANGSPYRVTAHGSLSDLDYPLALNDGTDDYHFYEIASVPGSYSQPVTDPPSGIMDDDKTVVIVYELDVPLFYAVGGTITGLPSGHEAGIDVYYTIDGGAPLSVSTDSTGCYEISGIPAGAEVIIFSPDDMNIGGVLYRCDPIAGYDISQLSSDVPDNDFFYSPAFTITGNVSGLDAEPTGNEFVPITVYITGPLRAFNRYVVRDTDLLIATDASGNYTIPYIPAGSTVVITAPASITPAVGMGTYSVRSPEGNVLTAANVQSNITGKNIVYGLSYTVSGSVVGLPDLLDIVISYTIDGVPGTTKTDVFGRYTVPFIPAGSQVVIDPLPNVTVGTISYLADPILGFDLTDVDSDIPGNNFTYIPTHIATGKVGGLPDNGGIVISYTITMPICLEKISGTAVTGSDGSYTIINIPDRAGIVITAPASIALYTCSPAGGYTVAHVVADAPDNNFLYMRALYAVGGNLSGLADNSGITINYTIDGVPGSLVTDENGDYLITDVLVGAQVVISAPGAPAGHVVSPAAGYTLDSITGNSLTNDFVFTADDHLIPGTGDTTDLIVPLGLLSAGLMFLAADVILRRKRRTAST